MFTSTSVKTGKKCAFCKHWYDPTNSYIRPKNPLVNQWEFDFNAKCQCLKRGVETKSVSFCPHYECKVPIK